MFTSFSQGDVYIYERKNFYTIKKGKKRNMIILFLLFLVGKWLVKAISYGVMVWLLPLILVLVILSVLGVKVQRLGNAILKSVGNAIVSVLTWITNRIPNTFRGIRRLYLFLSKRCFEKLPSWAANTLAILIIVII